MKWLTVPVLLAQGIAMVAAAEAVNAWVGSEFRTPIYAGGTAGIFVTLLGLPFALVLARVGEQNDSGGQFWVWWGAGLMVRLVVALGLAVALNIFSAQPTAALLALVGSYLIGMFAEAGWVAARLIKMDKK